MHLHINVRNLRAGPIQEIRHDHPNHGLVSHHENAVPASHKLHQHAMTSFLHIQIALSAYRQIRALRLPGYRYRSLLSCLRWYSLGYFAFISSYLRGQNPITRTSSNRSRRRPIRAANYRTPPTILNERNTRRYIVFIHQRLNGLVDAMRGVAQDRNRFILGLIPPLLPSHRLAS